MSIGAFQSTSLTAVQAQLDIIAEKIAEPVYTIAEYTKSDAFNAEKWLVKLNNVESVVDDDDDLPLLLCFHGVGSNPNNFKKLAKNLEKDNLRVYGVCMPGRLHSFMDAPANDLYNVVSSILDALKDLKLYTNSTLKRYKYIFLGHCLGGLIAYELARELSAKMNVDIDYLILSSVRFPAVQTSLNKERFGTKYFALSDKEIINTLIRLKGVPDFMLERRDLMTIFVNQIRKDFYVMEKYQYIADRKGAVPQLNCPVLYLGSRDDKLITQSDIVDWFSISTGGYNESIFSDGGHCWIHESAKLDILSEYVSTIIKKEDLILVEDD